VWQEIRNINVLAIQQVSFLGNKQTPDSTKKKKFNLLYPELIYIFSLDRTVRSYTDKNPSVGMATGLYPEAYVNSLYTFDSIMHWQMQNTARLQFQGKNENHYFLDYTFENLEYDLTSGLPSDFARDTLNSHYFLSGDFQLPGIRNTGTFYNSYLSSQFNRLFAKRIEMTLFGRYYLSGYRAGDFSLAGDISLTLGNTEKSAVLKLHADNELKTPEYLFSHYVSNHFIWTNNFKPTAINHLSMNLDLSSKKFDIQGDYYLIRNMIYMNTEAIPAQYINAFSLFSLKLTKRFDFWKITSNNSLVYQKAENEHVLGLPEITFYNSTYLKQLFNFKATGGKLLTMIGFDLFYNTKYYADAYMPALTSFYRQDEKKLGNYPYLNVFLNVQLKRFRFFLTLEHLNYRWIDKNYFSVLHYPLNERNLKFGLSWTFYD
jgi:hypothetical protein